MFRSNTFSYTHTLYLSLSLSISLSISNNFSVLSICGVGWPVSFR